MPASGAPHPLQHQHGLRVEPVRASDLRNAKEAKKRSVNTQGQTYVPAECAADADESKNSSSDRYHRDASCATNILFISFNPHYAHICNIHICMMVDTACY